MITPDRPKPALFIGDKLNNQELLRRTGLRPEDLNTAELEYRLKSGEKVRGNLRRVFKECPHVPDVIEKAYAEGGLDGVGRAFKGIEMMHGLKDGTLEISQETIALHQNKKKIDERQTPSEDTSFHQSSDSAVSEQPVAIAIQHDTLQVPHIEAIPQPILADLPQQARVTEKVTTRPDNQAERKQFTFQDLIIIPTIPQTAAKDIAIFRDNPPSETPEKVLDKSPTLVEAKSSVGKPELTAQVDQRLVAPDVIQSDQKLHGQKESSLAEAPTKEMMIRDVMEAMDLFISKDEQANPNAEASVVTMVKHEGHITLGIQAEEGKIDPENPDASTLKPISRADELIKMLDLLNQLSLGNQLLDRNALAGETKTHVLDRLINWPTTRRIQLEGEASTAEIPQLNLLVSKDILDFLEKGNKLFENTRDTKVVEEVAGEKAIEQRQSVRVFSGEKEIFIELETLKKLIELVKVRKEMSADTSDNATILEELGLHGMDYQNYDDDIPSSLAYPVISSLASADDAQLADYYQPIFFTHSSNHILTA